MSTNAALLALKRFGMGPRPGDLAAAASDPLELITADFALAGQAMPGADGLLDSAAAISVMRKDLAAPPEARAAKRSALSDLAAPASALPGYEKIFRDEVGARVRAGLTASPGFVERLVCFWSNHFAVSIAKGGKVRTLAGAFEREAIRPHVLGRFGDMLLAAELHQAMLVYLDNDLSLGPNSRTGLNRSRGYNENLAREILELHTLGVDGGYTQEDVKALAFILTGWTVLGPNQKIGAPGAAAFNVNWHEPGDFTLLGTVYADGGAEQAHAALMDLSRHPSTARFIAGKLARHFVADNPPQELVDRLAETFTATDGDLAAVATALLDSPEAWDPQHRKLRTPYEFLIAALRLCRIEDPQYGLILNSLRAMGQQLWTPPGPDGFPDGFDYWGSGEGLKTRIDVAVQIAELSSAEPGPLLAEAFGDEASDETRDTVMRAGDRQQAIALLLMAPEFQWR